ncbi:MAG: HAD-IIB family hydrolase [Deltaproteobacteria bacterium]|nr:HAD-IIB family hydrolase [Deltaproteobacteria bacterium]
MSPFIIFTDLDGTLLDHDTYSFEAAREALERVASAQVPLIICSSKTRAEIETWRRKLENIDPFISENGGGVFFPKTWKRLLSGQEVEKEGYLIVEFGKPYVDVLSRFKRLKDRFGETIKGFSEMSVNEIARATGLANAEAALAKQREYTEPFLFTGTEEEEKRLQENVAQMKLNLTRGGRFFHLMGDNDKGKAVIRVVQFYKKKAPGVRSVGMGDSRNDLPLLQSVDIPIVVQKPGGGYDDALQSVQGVRRAAGVGPEGWNKAVVEILGRKLQP